MLTVTGYRFAAECVLIGVGHADKTRNTAGSTSSPSKKRHPSQYRIRNKLAKRQKKPVNGHTTTRRRKTVHLPDNSGAAFHLSAIDVDQDLQYCWSALLVGIAGRHCWSALLVGIAGRHCWSALLVGIAGRRSCSTMLG
jgi:hypothetical protein